MDLKIQQSKSQPLLNACNGIISNLDNLVNQIGNLDQTQKAMLKDKPQFVEKPNLHPIEASEGINKIKLQMEDYKKLKVSFVLYRKIKENLYLIKLNSFVLIMLVEQNSLKEKWNTCNAHIILEFFNLDHIM